MLFCRDISILRLSKAPLAKIVGQQLSNRNGVVQYDCLTATFIEEYIS